MSEIFAAFVGWLEEVGYVVEADGHSRVCVHVWRGPDKYLPVLYVFHFVGMSPSLFVDGWSGDELNVWCGYTDRAGSTLSMLNTLRCFCLSDPGLFEGVLDYLRFHDGNVQEVGHF